MRWLLALLLIAVATLCSPRSGEAREYPWCAYFDWSTYNCGFYTLAQCKATISGAGGWCQRNPHFYAARRGRHGY